MKNNRKLKISLMVSALVVLALVLVPGCADEDDDENGVDESVLSDRSGYERCPADRVEKAKEYLASGNGDAARTRFQSILTEYPGCIDAHFGVVLADQLRFVGILDELLSLIIDPFPEEKGPIDVGAIVVDYAENLLEPIVLEILEHLEPCQNKESFRFDLERLPMSILGLEFLVYAGQYDYGDVLFQSAEFNLVAAALNTILSADLGFDFQIVLDHINAWDQMEVLDLIKDVLDMVMEILDDPNFPGFLTLRDDGYLRMPEAGLEMGYAFDFLNRSIDSIRNETRGSTHEVTSCADRNANSACDPDEFIHGIWYSLPSDLHAELQQVEMALRDSYWDGTQMDTAPGVPNPFTFDSFNPILQYFGLPPLLPPMQIDFGSMYAQPDPDGIREQVRRIVTIVRTLLDLFTDHLDSGLRDDDSSGAILPNNRPGEKTAGVPQGPPAVGLDTATDIAALPYLRPTARSHQLSSHDPEGGNDDGFTPPNHLTIDEHGEFVVFDSFGPGCIYRIQFTHTWSFIGNLRIYADDMETPVIEGPIWMLFFSLFEPFTEPLIKNWFTASGSCFCYIPIPFASRCRITANIPPEFFSITYVRYDADTPVVGFTGTEDTSLLRWMFSHPGWDPKPEVPSRSESGRVTIDPGESATLARFDSGGAIWRLYLAPEPFEQEALENLWLRAYWDGAPIPGVDVPIGEFFGSYFVEDAPKTLMMGHDGERFYSFYPMPFWQDAALSLTNQGPVPVEVAYEIVAALDTYAPGAGYFKAAYSEEDPVPAGRDFTIGDRNGTAGKWIGLTHTMRGHLSRWYLEGDERYYADGSASPALHGTGTEDYYNGGWYFLMGTFTEPLCGNPSHRVFEDHDYTGTYRLHLSDAVHYLDSARLGIEHGGSNSGNQEHYSSVAYYYELDRSLLRLSDTMDVGDPADESVHQYTAQGSDAPVEITSAYEGEDDEVLVTDSGRSFQGESRFRVSIESPNAGVILRRRFDQHDPGQRAVVLVEGVEVGVWHAAESSRTKRWAEDDFALPPSATSGKSSIEITIRVEGDIPWTEFAYWVYSIAP